MILINSLKRTTPLLLLLFLISSVSLKAQNAKPDELKFVRQGVQRMIFDEDQSIPLAKLQANKIIGLEAMHPITHYNETHANVKINEDKLFIQSEQETQTGIWFGGFNPFATYTIDLASTKGEGGKLALNFPVLISSNNYLLK